MILFFISSLLISCAAIAIEDVLQSNDTELELRNGRFFGFGTGLVRFANSQCTSRDGSSLGTCYTRRECSENGGTPGGRCAQVGVCCVVSQSCGGGSALNNTYFSHGNFPASSTCAFTIQPCGADICQVRIDFINFNLAQPNADGLCNVDALTVVGSAYTNIPRICGENSGSHIYADFNGLEPIRLVIQTGVSADVRTWKMKISQIACGSTAKAPSECLQYYTAISDRVTSFNFGTTISTANNGVNRPGTRQLANTNYGVCVASRAGFCSITWAPNGLQDFTVSHASITANPNDNGIINGNACLTDYVIIPNGNIPGVDRHCGNLLQPVTTSSKPYVMTVVTDGTEINDIGNRGFSMSYVLNRCNPLGG